MTDIIAITTDTLEAADACADGIETFRTVYPDGLDYDPNDPVQAAELLAGPLAGHLKGAVRKLGLPPQRVAVGDHGAASVGYEGTATAGDFGKAIAGECGTASAGVGGTAIAGNYGTATAGRHGVANAGVGGTAVAGNYGRATAGRHGSATVGYYGRATCGRHGTVAAGKGGTLVLPWWDGTRVRTVVTYVGEDDILPNVPYRLDEQGNFVRADGCDTQETT